MPTPLQHGNSNLRSTEGAAHDVDKGYAASHMG
eukprot:CAMPEP_0168358946 /NCGR_PEP_ID=MMETSP0228-20121227/1383_1 /TAXON_ID=133427 /ORGANISM="Protoceratium reticulatum, Strain CCCM 535 (=CCMP 1889)" /LENGTH=32 /DNA_ID= /DNA_START= /DNA_END= /DNA_ORIENTATION=